MTMLDATTAPLGADARAFVLLKSRRRLDLLNPDPPAWTDGNLAGGLSPMWQLRRPPSGDRGSAWTPMTSMRFKRDVSRRL